MKVPKRDVERRLQIFLFSGKSLRSEYEGNPRFGQQQNREMSKSVENVDENLDSSNQDAPDWIKIAVAIAAVAITLVIFLLWRSKRVLRRGVCLIGLCDSGKTQLFTQLIYKKAIETFTSIQENTGQLFLDQKKPLQIIDIPGHERVRQKFFDTYKSSARGVIYVIDSLNFTKDIRDVAEYLYTVLLDPVINSNRPPVLILCNKQDHALAKGMQVIKTQLEKEMNVLRNTKSNQLESATADAGNAKTFLGDEGKDFEFSDLHPHRIEFAMGSVQEGDLNDVTKWLNALA
nr:EOG090X0C7N [Sida crystallina]